MAHMRIAFLQTRSASEEHLSAWGIRTVTSRMGRGGGSASAMTFRMATVSSSAPLAVNQQNLSFEVRDSCDCVRNMLEAFLHTRCGYQHCVCFIVFAIQSIADTCFALARSARNALWTASMVS